jgi:hypothetical protein
MVNTFFQESGSEGSNIFHVLFENVCPRNLSSKPKHKENFKDRKIFIFTHVYTKSKRIVLLATLGTGYLKYINRNFNSKR